MKNGIATVVLPDEEVAELMRRALEGEGYRLTVDLAACEVRDEKGFSARFEMDEFRRRCLLEGLDETGLTLLREEEIAAFESRRPRWLDMDARAGAS